MKFPSIICLLIGGACILMSQGCATIPLPEAPQPEIDISLIADITPDRPCGTLKEEWLAECLEGLVKK